MSHAQSEVKTNKNQYWNIVWFNSPFSQKVKTNTGKIFLQLIKKHFPNHHRLHKIFSLNTMKLSYSCMSNMSSFIKEHNHNILYSPPNNEERSCNCRNKDNCPLAGSCWKRALFTELMLSSKMKHTYIMAHLIESSSIGTTITQIHVGIKIMKTKLNSQNIFGSQNVMGLSSI